MPKILAAEFFERVHIGTPVIVVGSTRNLARIQPGKVQLAFDNGWPAHVLLSNLFIWQSGSSRMKIKLDRWHQVERLPRWPRADYFKVQASDGRLYLLKHDLDADQWFLVRRWYEILRRPC